VTPDFPHADQRVDTSHVHAETKEAGTSKERYLWARIHLASKTVAVSPAVTPSPSGVRVQRKPLPLTTSPGWQVTPKNCCLVGNGHISGNPLDGIPEILLPFDDHQ